jgi:hypothetical protein
MGMRVYGGGKFSANRWTAEDTKVAAGIAAVGPAATQLDEVDDLFGSDGEKKQQTPRYRRRKGK